MGLLLVPLLVLFGVLLILAGVLAGVSFFVKLAVTLILIPLKLLVLIFRALLRV